MKLRLVLFSSCTLLFSSLSSLSLNAQQEREARLRVTTSLPTLAANGAKPEFGPNVLIFDPAMPSQAIQKQIDAVYSTQEHNEFGQQRNALLFLPGNYSVDVPVGFYTEVMGLGASPDATRIAGNVHADANHEHNNATTTFWRAVEGLSIKPAGGTMQWAVSQAVSLRRMHVHGDLVLFFSSGRRHTGCSRDWSSDVCSSDLWPIRSAPRGPNRPTGPLRASSGCHRPSGQTTAAMHWPRSVRRESRPAAARYGPAVGPARREIGRASCRERV